MNSKFTDSKIIGKVKGKTLQLVWVRGRVGSVKFEIIKLSALLGNLRISPVPDVSPRVLASACSRFPKLCGHTGNYEIRTIPHLTQMMMTMMTWSSGACWIDLALLSPV